jgi:hypothetical protein
MQRPQNGDYHFKIQIFFAAGSVGGQPQIEAYDPLSRRISLLALE